MTIKLINTKTLPLTIELAKKFAEMNKFCGDRALRKEISEMLRARIADGLFHTPKWATAYLDGQMYRVNGQHSSTVLAEENGNFPKGLLVVIDEFACDTADDLATLFDQFDNSVSARRVRESYNAHAKTITALTDIKARVIEKAVAGIALSIEMSTGQRLAGNERTHLIHENTEFICTFAADDELGLAIRSIARAPSVAAFYTIWSKLPELRDKCREFWVLVGREDHPETNNATRVLARFLRECNRAAKAQWSQRAIYSKCIHGWNAFRKDQGTALSYFVNSPVPEPK